MALDAHVRRGHPIVFGLLLLFSLVEIAVSGWLTGRYNANHNYTTVGQRDRTRFTLFVSCWTAFFAFLYGILHWHAGGIGSIMTSVGSYAVFLFLTWVMWTAAAAAVTQTLGGGLNCKTQELFVYCSQLNALEAFAWINWILVTLALAFVIVRGIISARRGDGFRGQLSSA